MPSRSEALASHIERTVTGPMWHGPALNDVVDGASAADARHRPIAGAHTIWEIVLHVAAWAEIVRDRVAGKRLADPSASENWPAVDADDRHWPAAVERMRDSYRRLADDVRRLDDAALAAEVPGLGYSVSAMLRGVVEHGTYHGGQIALLRRGVRTGTAKDAKAAEKRKD